MTRRGRKPAKRGDDASAPAAGGGAEASPDRAGAAAAIGTGPPAPNAKPTRPADTTDAHAGSKPDERPPGAEPTNAAPSAATSQGPLPRGTNRHPIFDGPATDTPPTILVVDDDRANLIAAEAVLADLGYPVITANSGAEALRQVLRHDFAVILLDVRMPVMDGYETAEMIRQRERSRHVPIIFLSGVDKEDQHQFRGYAAGAVDYVLKPVPAIVLKSKVQVFAQLFEQTQQIRRRAEAERRLMAENLAVRARTVEVARALERSLVSQSLVLEALPLALFTAGRNPADRRFVGGKAHALCGLSEEVSMDGDWLPRVHEDDRPRLLAAFRSVDEAGSYEIEYRIVCEDGERWMLERGDLRTAADGGAVLYGVVTDITSRKRLEEQLTHAQKLEAIGQLSGGVAHDFNNMLGVIIGSLDRVLSTGELDERSRQRLGLAMQAAESCADLTKRLLGFARRQSLQPRHLDIPAELDRLSGLFERVLGETVTARIDCPPDLPPVWLDGSQFEGAIVNLAVNARDAMPDGGTLTVAARLIHLDGNEALPADLPAGAEFIRLSVTDTGTGMDAATQARALEPFFTTKAPNKGTGLGLSSIYGFLRQSGGGMRIESAPGQGTTIHLYLPPNTQAAAQETGSTTPETQSLDGLQVALVEDNDRLREVGHEMLVELGCEVQVFDSADAAAGLDPGRIDLLLADCVMPGDLDGPSLARRLRTARPDLPVLLSSGYVADSEPLESDNVEFLPKPYDEAQLARAIHAAIRRTDGAG